MYHWSTHSLWKNSSNIGGHFWYKLMCPITGNYLVKIIGLIAGWIGISALQSLGQYLIYEDNSSSDTGVFRLLPDDTSPFRNDWASIVKEGLALVLTVEHWGTKTKSSFPYQEDWRTSSDWGCMCDLVSYSRSYWPLIFWRTFEMILFCLNWEFDIFSKFLFISVWTNRTFQIMDMWKLLYIVHVLKLSGYSITEFP